MAEILGTRLGRYEIRERIGKGGMAAVYKAWDTNLDRWVAVKVLHDYLAEEKGFKERFEREAKVVASLNHPNIVQVYDFDVTERDGQPLYYMVMAYIAGPSLKSIMDERHTAGKRLTLAEIENVMKGICSALAYAHQRGMVHRDVTPGNILFNDHNQAVLADFGIARIISGARLTQTGMTSGTPMYMSPEQGMGEPGDSRSDIYSLGVILYEMLAGEAPYSGDSAYAIIMQHVNQIPSPIAGKMGDLPAGLESVVLRALAKQPEARYQDATSLLKDFEAVLAGQEVTAPAQAAVQPAPKTVTLPVKENTQTAGQARPARIPWAFVVGGLAIIAVILVLAAAARSFQVAAVPTATQPTNQVSTSAPSGTTPPAAAMTDEQFYFSDDFTNDTASGKRTLLWPETDSASIYRKIENGAYHIWQTNNDAALTTLFDATHYTYQAGNQYEADITILPSSQPESATGLIFRYVSDDEYYVFTVDGLGRVSIWMRKNKAWSELRNLPTKWTPATGVNPIGQANHLKLIDLGNEFQGYVNGNMVVDIHQTPQIDSGNIGIYLATTASDKPRAEILVDNFSVSAYMPPTPTTESMVDEGTPTTQSMVEPATPTTASMVEPATLAATAAP